MTRQYSSLQWKKYHWERAWVENTSQSQQLRTRWSQDRKRYIARFRLDDEEQLRILEECMHYLTEKCCVHHTGQRQKAIEAKEVFASTLQAGQNVVQTFVSRLLADADIMQHFEMTAIDFEGTVDDWGVKEFGGAKLSAATLALAAAGDSVETATTCFNFANATNRQRKFAFGTSTRVSPELLVKAIHEQLADAPTRDKHDTRLAPSPIILVGHNIRADIDIMKSLGVSLEQLPRIIGVVDTWELAKQVLGRSLSLENLLKELNIPYEYNALHCAGNDAHYALQTMLALLYLQATDQRLDHANFDGNSQLELLRQIVHQPARQRPTKRHGPPEQCTALESEDCFDTGLFA